MCIYLKKKTHFKEKIDSVQYFMVHNSIINCIVSLDNSKYYQMHVKMRRSTLHYCSGVS